MFTGMYTKAANDLVSLQSDTKLLNLMPLLKAVVMKSDSALVAALPCVLVADTTPSLCLERLLEVVHMITADISGNSTVC